MRRAHAMLGLSSAVILSAAAFAALPRTSQASATAPISVATFLVPAHDGYGAADCLLGGTACGQAVADTWCEAQGYVHATAFRQVKPEDVTGAVQPAALSSVPPVSITCSN